MSFRFCWWPPQIHTNIYWITTLSTFRLRGCYRWRCASSPAAADTVIGHTGHTNDRKIPIPTFCLCRLSPFVLATNTYKYYIIFSDHVITFIELRIFCRFNFFFFCSIRPMGGSLAIRARTKGSNRLLTQSHRWHVHLTSIFSSSGKRMKRKRSKWQPRCECVLAAGRNPAVILNQ